MMKEHFLLIAGNRTWYKTGTETSVLKDGDFFTIKSVIVRADKESGKKVKVTMFHTHPRGFENFSQADIDTMTGLRLGLDRDFLSVVVLPKTLLGAYVWLRNNKVGIYTSSDLLNFAEVLNRWFISWLFRKHIKKLRRLTYGA